MIALLPVRELCARISHGTNHLVGTDRTRIIEVWGQVKASAVAPAAPPLWDGRAAERIVDVLERFWSGGQA